MDRRQLIAGTAALAALAATSGHLKAAEVMEHNHGHNPYAELIKSSIDCLEKGRICQAHCLESFKAKDTELAKCLEQVVQMMAAVDALNQLAISGSKYVKEFAGVCQKICLDCAEECKKHAKKHNTCKDCMDACLSCADACKKVA
ncbi:MAG: hypothetical protein A2508_04785 [Candidatus Lambdaproteobacteria bacterium RIFOXYD12_FULL_49_8]|nr:MAG: hypothetical protein A2508_04785 [Candidatus Lambdaproteobacteria bacterium RIFOXYD12_FULL_49_8]